MVDRLYLGVDVGTGSVRAGLFDAAGVRRGMGVHPIQMWHPEQDYAEQSSEDIWSACGQAVRAALGQAGASPDEVAGIGFDATCSLVVLGEDDRPLTVSPTGNDQQNVIVWMDHRAVAQAERINETGHRVLDYVGGRISPEMEPPKLLWLRDNLPDTWKRAARFLDLADFMSYRATGDDTRSLCTTVCKWAYLGHEDGREGSVGRWDDSFFEQIGLEELVQEGYQRIGTRVRPMGERVGGLTQGAAAELGLAPGTAVAVPIIDAHAGGVGMLGAHGRDGGLDADALERALALIGGTSSCHMAVSRDPRFVPGVWGPYYSAMVPELWLNEGGQSATGALIDHIIFSHARGAELRERAEGRGGTVYELLNERLHGLAEFEEFPARLTREIHVFPDFHGNRSPRADPTLRGMISGLKLSDSVDALAVLYLATVQAVAYGTRHIIAQLGDYGYALDTVVACGGGAKNPVFLREHADATGCRIVLPREPEAVLLGSAMLGAVAAGAHGSVMQAMDAMQGADRVIEPARGWVRDYHDQKYSVFHRMYDDQMAYRWLMRQGRDVHS